MSRACHGKNSICFIFLLSMFRFIYFLYSGQYCCHVISLGKRVQENRTYGPPRNPILDFDDTVSLALAFFLVRALAPGSSPATLKWPSPAISPTVAVTAAAQVSCIIYALAVRRYYITYRILIIFIIIIITIYAYIYFYINFRSLTTIYLGGVVEKWWLTPPAKD